MKKSLIGILIMILVFSFFACATKDDEESAKDDTSASQKEEQSKEDTETDKEQTPTEDAVTYAFIGTWVSQGRLLSDGSIEDTGYSYSYELTQDGKAKFVSKEDGSEKSATGTFKEGESSVTVNIDGKDTKLNVNEDGNLLYPTGERDGKGNELCYLLKKS